MTRTILVECTFQIPVEVPADKEYFDNVEFHIEENHCPGTGDVGRALDELIEKHDKQGTCWACAVGGKNKIIDYDYNPNQPH